MSGFPPSAMQGLAFQQAQIARMNQIQAMQQQQQQHQQAFAQHQHQHQQQQHYNRQQQQQQQQFAMAGPSTQQPGAHLSSQQPPKKKKKSTTTATTTKKPSAPAPMPPHFPGNQQHRPPTAQEIQHMQQQQQQQRMQQQQQQGGPPPQGNLPVEYVRPMPEEDPSMDEMERVSARELAILRYRRRHKYMEEIFSPVSIADLPKSPEPYAHMDVEALEKQVADLERENAEASTGNPGRLQEYKERFEGISRGGVVV